VCVDARSAFTGECPVLRGRNHISVRPYISHFNYCYYCNNVISTTDKYKNSPESQVKMRQVTKTLFVVFNVVAVVTSVLLNLITEQINKLRETKWTVQKASREADTRSANQKVSYLPRISLD
jgi:hypothetical protein